MMGKMEDLEKQWPIKTKEITEEQKLEMIGRVVEIAIRIVFENFCHDFGGKTFLPMFGGPIGARLTMACTRVGREVPGNTREGRDENKYIR